MTIQEGLGIRAGIPDGSDFDAQATGEPILMVKRAVCVVGLVLMAACGSVPPVELEATQTLVDHGAADPTIAIDARTGAVYAAWAAMEPDKTWNIVLSASTETAKFTAPVRVNRVPGEAVSSNQFPPQVQVGTGGVVHVAWLALESPPGPADQDKVVVIKVARSDDAGATFESPATLGIEDRGPVPSLYFDMATGPDHAVYVAWLDLSRYAAQEVEHAKSKPAKEPAPADGDLRFARSTDGGRTFTTSPVLDSNSCICCRTSVAGGPDGTAYLMWRHVFPVNERDVVVAVAPSSGPISAPVRVHDDHWKLDGCPDLGPDIGVGSDGKIHVAWYTAAPGLQGLHYARSSDGGRTFGRPVPLLTGPAIPGSQVKLAVENDVPWLVWEEVRPSETRLRLAHVSGADSVEVVKDPIGTGISPAIATGHGRIAVAWSEQGAVHVRLGRLGAPRGKASS